MDSFKKLLNIVRQKDSSLITEEQATELSNAYDSNIALIEEQAEKCGIAKGYADGFAEGKAVATASFADEKARLVSESVNTTKKIVKKAEMKAFAAGKKAMIKEAKSTIVENADALLTECVEKCDNEATEKLNVLLEAIDNKHTAALEKVYNLMSEKNAALQIKIDALIAENELATAKINEITEENNKLNDAILNKGNECINQVCEQVDRYLNSVLEEKIPSKQVVMESKFNASQNAIGRIIDVLKINDILQESRSNVILDYENKITEAKNSASKLACENAELTKKLNRQQATILLESKLTKCTDNEATYLRNYFKNADNSRIIEEQIEGARLAYRKLYEEKRNANVASLKSKTNHSSSNMVSESSAPVEKKPEVIVESRKEVKNEASMSAFDIYTNAYRAMTNRTNN